MKITRLNKFTPVSITFESKEELASFCTAIGELTFIFDCKDKNRIIPKRIRDLVALATQLEKSLKDEEYIITL